MTNILFFTERQIVPNIGGTERITNSVASTLTKYGNSCFSSYKISSNKEDIVSSVFKNSLFVGSVIDKEQFKNFLKKNEISYLLVQGDFDSFDSLYDVAKSLNVKVYFAHHFQPGWDAEIIKIINANQNDRLFLLKSLRDILTYPKRKLNLLYNTRKKYRNVYSKADKIILLSKNFIKPFKRFSGIADTSKFEVIPNSLSFETYYDKDKLNDKKKIVLIVARFDDNQKRILSALKIWEKVCLNQIAKEWHLKIVGFGEDYEKYRSYVENHDMTNVSFEGKQDSYMYYQEAAIFMMTSRSEGWGLTLTESQQSGVVPIAFRSYESVSDIITNGENGFLIKDKDVASYANCMVNLMSNDELRKKIAISAIESSHRFDPFLIGKKWCNLFN